VLVVVVLVYRHVLRSRAGLDLVQVLNYEVDCFVPTFDVGGFMAMTY
jgi:hypothetical protein